MADHIDFSVNQVARFREGADHARSDLWRIQRETEYQAQENLFQAEKILKYVEGVLNMMEEDRKTAEQVREHNKVALDRMKNRLYELERELSRLEQQHVEALREVCDAQAYWANAIGSPLSPDASDDEKRAHQSHIDAARQAYDAAERRERQIKEAIKIQKEKIEALRKLIDRTKKIIEELAVFIRKIKEQIVQVDQYRRRLIDDSNKLKWEMPKFSNASHESAQGLGSCVDQGGKAMEYGRRIWQALDPEGSAGGDSCAITFTDHNAMGYLYKELQTVCGDYEDAEEDVRERARGHSQTMQDAVIANAGVILTEVCGNCRNTVRKLQQTARDCRTADMNLRAYYDLRR